MSIWDWLLNPAGLTPHGFCLSWAPGLVALHAVSDAIIGLAYFSIPLALAVFVHRRRDIEYSWVFYLFVGFILACGATHLMSILTLWVPAYGIDGLIKAVTAAASIVTAVILWPLIPKLLALPSPAQLALVNGELTLTVAEKERTAELLRNSEARVKAVNADLESRVAEQTSELMAANMQLTGALEQRDLLIREVYHRVKNNLQTIDALMAMHSREITDTDAKDALLSLRQRVYALGLVHQQLMQSSDLKTFDIAPFLHDLSHNIIEAGAARNIDVSVNSIPLKVGLDFAIPLGLLVTELLTNALKHAFPSGRGKIDVVLKHGEGSGLALIVNDDGKGLVGALPPPNAPKPGQGINIITGLVNQLRGSMTMQHDRGTRTEILVATPVAP